MLRITQLVSEDRSLTLRLEGRVVGPWVEELERTCSSLLARHPSTTLELTGVAFLDADGAELLLRLQEQGVRLTGGSAFLREYLECVSGPNGTDACDPMPGGAS